VYLASVGTFIPDNRIQVRDTRVALGLTDTRVRYYEKYLGFARIAVAPDGDVASMLVPAGVGALRGVDRRRVRYLVYAHTAHHLAPPSSRTVDRVRERLGLADATAFALTHLNCAGALYAVQLARHLLAGESPDALALVLTGELARSPWLRVIPGTAVMGEAAAACLVGRRPPGDEILGFAVRVLGRFYPAGDCAKELVTEYERQHADTFAAVIREALNQAGTAPEEISVVLPNNVNRYSWASVARLTGIPLDRFYRDNIAELGHCFGADPFINLAHAKAGGRAEPGAVVLLVTSGLGAVYSALVARVREGVAT
jgi:3-oxoacyl-[acyl-carrier-protein] synthase-3